MGFQPRDMKSVASLPAAMSNNKYYEEEISTAAVVSTIGGGCADYDSGHYCHEIADVEVVGSVAAVPQVIGELDNLLAAVRVLIRICEREKLHRQVHTLQLSLELLLRRRNYLLNVYVAANKCTPPPYDRYPCDNCHITYPTGFLMSCLDRLLGPVNTTLSTADSPPQPSHPLTDSTFCNQSCFVLFETDTYAYDAKYRTDRLIEGVLYPMGAPFVAGPSCSGVSVGEHRKPTATRLFGESDEVELVYTAVRFVSKTLASDWADVDCAEVDLADNVADVLETRKHFGFDMDCVHDANVDLARSRLAAALETYEARVVAETFDRELLSRCGEVHHNDGDEDSSDNPE